MDDELNAWKDLYAQQQTATQTVAELGRVRARDRWRHAAELVSSIVIVVGASVYLGTSSTPAMLVGVALLTFLAAAGLHQWSVTRGLERALFTAPADYAKELAERNAREIRRLTPIWPLVAAIGVAILVTLDLALGWSGERPSPMLTTSVVAAESGVIILGFWWRRRELAALLLERTAISEMSP